MKNKSNKPSLKKYPNGGKKIGEFLGNYGKSLIDVPASALGLNNLIPDSAYKGTGSELFEGYSNVAGTIGKALLPTAANMIVPGSGIAVQAAQQGLSTINPEEQASYKLGGIHQGVPNAEVESEEVMRMPNGITAQVDGPSHKNGGVPVNIPNGTQIFSDRLKVPGSKITFAKQAEKFKVNKQTKTLEDNNSTGLAKETAKLVHDIKQKKLDELFNTQETLKQAKLNKYASKLGLDISNKFPNGGTKLPQYDGGGWSDATGTYDGYGNKIAGPMGVIETNEQYTNAHNYGDAFNVGKPWGIKTPNQIGYLEDVEKSYKQSGLTALDPYTKVGPNIKRPAIQTPNTVPTVGSTPPGMTNTPITVTPNQSQNINWNQNISNPNSPSFNNSNSQNNSKTSTDSTYKPSGIDYAMMAANLAGPIYNLATNKKPKPFTYDKVNPTLVKANIDPINKSYKAMSKLSKDTSLGNTQDFYRKMAIAEAKKSGDIRDAYYNRDLTNAQILNQAETVNTQIKNQNIDAMQQDMARYRDINRQAVSNLGTNTASLMRDYKAGKMDNVSAKMISDMFANYKLDMNNPSHIKWVFEKLGK